MLNHAWWGMLKVGIRHRIGIHVVVLRLPIMTRRIVARHYFEKLNQGNEETWLKLMLRAGGKVAVIGTHVIQWPKLQGCEDDRPCLTKGTVAGTSGARGFRSSRNAPDGA